MGGKIHLLCSCLREERQRDRDRRKDRGKRNGDSDAGYGTSRSSRRNDWEKETPRAELGNTTPNPRLSDIRTPSRSSWDPDERPMSSSSSKWDMPSPSPLRGSRDSGNEAKIPLLKDTPLPTPTHRYNLWADDRKSLGITPGPGKQEEGEAVFKFSNTNERAEWEEEQKRLDRAWYDYDGGFDDTRNPFANLPEEYTKKKEEQLAKKTVKRMSARQRQVNKVSTL